ncbi:RAMP superfamily CRISPR-associated protein [Vibrio mexicanus]|uniref:RAMP superfamily CRISPR-associated protein n=1 Tax=Vibrio mexicanus TaxID=1004326 RepID=UPI00063C91F5|nr:RAMP superfamily CRISPR-associated protein [Vibrio mexicanus]
MSFIFVNHITIETQSPMAIGTGEREVGFDNQLVRDINNLPYIPSSTISGVWHHLTLDAVGQALTHKWFGQLEHKSKLAISHGYLLDSQQQIVKGLVTQERIQDDVLLAFLQQQKPMHRERVRLNDRGVAADKGKFDQILLPTGVRFRVTLQWQGDSEQDLKEFQSLISLWSNRQFAFGSSTTNGLGQVKIIGQCSQQIKLTNNPLAGKQLQASLNEYIAQNISHSTNDTLFAQLSLKASGTWRSGQGTQHLSDEGASIDADIITHSEPQIVWNNQGASIQQKIPVLQASTYKALSPTDSPIICVAYKVIGQRHWLIQVKKNG